MKSKYLYIFMLVFIFLYGCKSTEKIRRLELGTYNINSEIKSRVSEIEDSNDHLLIQNSEFQISGTNLYNGRVTIYIERKERIFLSMRFLGFEVIRAQLTPDSIMYINRLNRQYLFAESNKFKNLLPLPMSYSQLEYFILSGFVFEGMDGKGELSEFIEKININEDYIHYKEIVNDGNLMEGFYTKQGIYLENFSYSDYDNNMFTELKIERKSNSEPDVIEGALIENGNENKFRITLKDIQNIKYNSTDFKVGRNYTRIESIF